MSSSMSRNGKDLGVLSGKELKLSSGKRQDPFVNMFYSLFVWTDTSLHSHFGPVSHNSASPHGIGNHCLLSSAILNTPLIPPVHW